MNNWTIAFTDWMGNEVISDKCTRAMEKNTQKSDIYLSSASAIPQVTTYAGTLFYQFANGLMNNIEYVITLHYSRATSNVLYWTSEENEEKWIQLHELG